MDFQDYEKIFESYPSIMKITDLTKMLNIGKNKAYDLLRDRSIEHIKIGTRYKIPKKAVIDYILKTQDTGKKHAIIE
ncbi:helix-turn-helix domain-containing protein [Enterococcus sp. DIV1420a]|uniref:helix-turn-helix domain-containing protein n=1 Tax=Enterococcus TaxID=1350 RepID=UPI0036D7263B